MLRLALASVMTGLMAFAAVAFWPSGGPSREVRVAVIQQASIDPALETIESVLADAGSKEQARLDGELADTGDTASELEVASLEEQPSAYDAGPETDASSGFDGGTVEGENLESDGSIDTAWIGEADQTSATFSEDGSGLPRLPVRKPARPQPPLTNYSLVERIAEIGPGAIARIEEKFADAGVAWPPQRLAFLAFKDEKVIEVQAQSADGNWQPVYRYPILRASGYAGPKLREGDRQVPEGLYRIASLNPNSRYHVSLRVGYPNDFDRAMAKSDGRKKLGGDIMIHGKALSIGCLAVGDPASEEFFVMAHSVGLYAIDVIIAPRDFRKPAMFATVKESINFGQPSWVPKLYDDIKAALAPFPQMPPKVEPTIAQR